MIQDHSDHSSLFELITRVDSSASSVYNDPCDLESLITLKETTLIVLRNEAQITLKTAGPHPIKTYPSSYSQRASRMNARQRKVPIFA